MCECGGVSFSELGRILHSWYTLQRSCLCAYVYRFELGRLRVISVFKYIFLDYISSSSKCREKKKKKQTLKVELKVS